ncbi:MAG TPA: hypothetical protein QF683_06490 [SAR324 cluster bacterium]|jgi:hypothetical protein|nr:hypothetical protein [SAR324 cluster bacterium]MDP7611049.1 hypothetical protein [Nitrospinaceae bacterium]HJO44281.1 hypothetical protein [SAR324 cluster bacterium]
MKHLLLTTIAAVVLVGCGIFRFIESQCFSSEFGRTVGLWCGSSELP